MKRYIQDIVAVIGFLVVVFVFFRQVFFGMLPVPSDSLVGLYHPWRDYFSQNYPRGVPFKNFLITDPVRQQIPWKKLVIDSWKRGEVPWWNPYVFSGAPLAANIQSAAFYPLNILFFLFTFPTAWTVLIMLQPILGGIFLYTYLRHRELPAFASFIGSIVWSFCGFSTAWLTWGTISQTALWIPLMLLGVDKVLAGKKNWWALLSLFLAMSIVAGHIQIALYSIILAFCYACVQPSYKKNNTGRRGLLLASIVACFLTIPQWVPTLNLIFDSARGSSTAWQAEGFFIPWQHLIQFVVPDFFGNPATLNYWGIWNWAEFVGFIGIAPLLFALIAVFAYRQQSKFWVWTVGVSLLFALPTVVAKLPYQLHIPLVSSLQPTRLLVLIDFALAVLAAQGVAQIMQTPRKWYVPVVFLGVIFVGSWIVVVLDGRFGQDAQAVANFAIAKRNLILPTAMFLITLLFLFTMEKLPRFKLYILAGLMLVSVFDLFRFAGKFTPFSPTSYFFPETPVIRFLSAQPKPFRVLALDERILPPNVASYYGIETIEGYDPVYSSSYETLFAAVKRGEVTAPPYGFNRILTTNNIDSPLLPYLNVEYVLSLSELDRPFLEKVFEEGETKVYEYKNSLPRVMLVDRMIHSLKREEALRTLMATRGFVATVPLTVQLFSTPLTLGEAATIRSFSNNNLTIDVMASTSRMLAISATYDRGWSAKVDGTSVPVFRINYALMGIPVPEGTSEVRLYYNPLQSILSAQQLSL